MQNDGSTQGKEAVAERCPPLDSKARRTLVAILRLSITLFGAMTDVPWVFRGLGSAPDTSIADCSFELVAFGL
jgi:hypothetical protein